MSKKNKSLTDFPKMEDGDKIAVLYSPEFGAGWSSWNRDEWSALMTMHKEIVQNVLDGNTDEAAATAERLIREATKKNDEYVCVLGAGSLKVQWIDSGSQFEIEEYDGNESVHVVGSRSYLTT